MNLATTADMTPSVYAPPRWIEARPDVSGSANGTSATSYRQPGTFAKRASELFHGSAPSTGKSTVSHRAPRIVETGSARADAEGATRMSRADEIADERVALMARQYAGESTSREIAARLEILSTRLLQVAPRVTDERVATLENAERRLAAVSARREERARRLGLPG
jgi:hypothetical protein